MGLFRWYWAPLLLFLGGNGCSGPPAHDGFVGGPGDGPTSVYMRAVSSVAGEFVCEDQPDPDYRCVSLETGEAWVCKILADDYGTVDYHCLPDPGVEQPWEPACPEFHQMGDQLSGLPCWAPPENYCAAGCAGAEAWYCREDGSKCCLSRCLGCFHCGWVEMMDCRVSGELESADPGECDAIFWKLPSVYRDCMETGGAGPECQFIHQDPECQVDIDMVICPG